jgi:polysaccharide pyruvyl transferase WcaK-like protein
MEIAIIGWYGTETIGDRAIFAGILRILSEAFGFFSVRLGSLYPFYTQRTLLEDYDFYKIAARNNNLSIKIFDTRNPFELKHNVKHSDILMVGGGPLMDLEEMSMLDFAYNIASRYKLKKVLMGCGWGPLKTEKAISIARKLIFNSDLVIFRDTISKEQAIKHGCDNAKLSSIIDPAFIACNVYLDSSSARLNDHISINFRDVLIESSHFQNKRIRIEVFSGIVSNILTTSQLPIHLVPMHYFFIGGDDRIILNKIAHIISSDKVTVVQKPMSLKQTMDEFYNAAYCIGMRFHSIVLQTALNGKNYIVDYTDPSNGKIIGMMKKLGMEDEYSSRYFSLSTSDYFLINEISKVNQYSIPKNLMQQFQYEYIKLTSSLLK